MSDAEREQIVDCDDPSYLADPERGWYFFQRCQEEPERSDLPEQVGAGQVGQRAEKDDADPCSEPDTWTVDCGFVDPGDDFEFQAKQRDELSKAASMSPDDVKKVLAWQRYTHWVYQKARQMADMWLYNRTQNPELNPMTINPNGRLEYAVMSSLRRNAEDEVLRILLDKAEFIYVSSNTCNFCNIQLPRIHDLAQEFDLPITNISIDETCIEYPYGEFDECISGEAGVISARLLHAQRVPSTFVILPEGQIIRIATGVSSKRDMRRALLQFVAAYRSAISHEVAGADEVEDVPGKLDFSVAREMVLNRNHATQRVPEPKIGEVD